MILSMTLQSQQQNSNMTILPKKLYLPINHCNLPAVILGNLTYQQHPVPLYLDSVNSMHKDLFERLKEINESTKRATKFRDYMAVYFQLSELEEATNNNTMPGYKRIKANYLTVLRGWLFDNDNREGAILKGWVESRFGLLPTWHKEKINSAEDEQYLLYLHEKTTGIYNTNALESQLDLLYSFCQFELTKNKTNETHILLYRGIDNITAKNLKHNDNVLMLNNLNSFSSSRERANEFADVTVEVQVPQAKVFYYSGLLPGLFHGEDEYIVIGGMVRVKVCSHIK